MTILFCTFSVLTLHHKVAGNILQSEAIQALETALLEVSAFFFFFASVCRNKSYFFPWEKKRGDIVMNEIMSSVLPILKILFNWTALTIFRRFYLPCVAKARS